MNGAEDRGTTYNLLFVCTGNTCRSPMAAALARHAVSARGWSQVRVESAGTGAEEGTPASAHAIGVMRDLGLELAGHSTRPLTREWVKWADLVLVMSERQRTAARELGGGDKVFLLTEFLDGPEAGLPIEDPFGGDRATYAETRDRIWKGVEATLEWLSAIIAP